jgi:protein TonB
MFSNLIESSSHVREFKRRGSFVLFTGATYAILFVAAGVASIYAYDARLEEPDSIVVTMLPPTELPATQAAHNPTPAHEAHAASGNIAIRQTAMASVNDPHIVPDRTSAVASKNEPIPSGRWKIGSTDYDPPVAGNTGRGSGNGPGSGPDSGGIRVDAGTPPPDVPVHKAPPPRVVSKGAIAGLALSLPKPVYPSLAKQAHVQGAVTVQVLVDETGRVVSARAVSGHPLLLVAAQQAALQAKFSPTKLGDQAVKVSGVITYNFQLQ